MANVLQELSDICRFCLCHNVKLLLPIAKTLDKLLTIEDIERFTGIQITSTAQAVCLECINKLKISTEFRNFCLRTNTRFQTLHSVLIESAQSVTNDANECLELSDDDDDDDDIAMLNFDFLEEKEHNCGDRQVTNNTSVSRQTHKQETGHSKEPITCSRQKLSTAHDETNSEDYSANYIELGETLVSDEEDIDPNDWIYVSLNPTYPRVGSCQRVKGKRRKHLCDACGRKFADLSYHYFTHSTEATFACPHCPAMIKTKNGLLAHIKTVHYKMITKTCEICGKGFVHHKTYRYHMSIHKSEGDTFECKPCSKTFIHPAGYQSHIKKFHSITKK